MKQWNGETPDPIENAGLATEQECWDFTTPQSKVGAVVKLASMSVRKIL
jgi:hypothetical protein